MRIVGTLTPSFHLLLKGLKCNPGLNRGFLSSSHCRQITRSLENYTGTHTGTPYYVTTALTGATSWCKRLHLKLIGCLKSIMNSSFWLFWSWKQFNIDTIQGEWQESSGMQKVVKSCVGRVENLRCRYFHLAVEIAKEVVAVRVTSFYFLQSMGRALWMPNFLFGSRWPNVSWE